MLTIEIWSKNNSSYFVIILNDIMFYSSSAIAKLLNLSVSNYNDILVKEVIKHKYYNIRGTSPHLCLFLNLTFHLDNISKDIYIERFKETFADKLTLLNL